MTVKELADYKTKDAALSIYFHYRRDHHQPLIAPLPDTIPRFTSLQKTDTFIQIVGTTSKSRPEKMVVSVVHSA